MTKVLIVDDDNHSATVLEKILARHGHQTRIAANAGEALMIARDFVPEVVLTDISLPGMDGYELARTLKEQAETKPRVIAVTGYSQEPEPRSSWLDGYLVKPVHFPQLLQILEPVVQPS